MPAGARRCPPVPMVAPMLPMIPGCRLPVMPMMPDCPEMPELPGLRPMTAGAWPMRRSCPMLVDACRCCRACPDAAMPPMPDISTALDAAERGAVIAGAPSMRLAPGVGRVDEQRSREDEARQREDEARQRAEEEKQREAERRQRIDENYQRGQENPRAPRLGARRGFVHARDRPPRIDARRRRPVLEGLRARQAEPAGRRARRRCRT